MNIRILVGLLAVLILFQSAEAQWPRFQSGPDPRGHGSDDYVPPDPTQIVLMIEAIDRQPADEETAQEIKMLRLKLGQQTTDDQREDVQGQIDRLLNKGICTVTGQVAILSDSRGRWSDRNPQPAYCHGATLVIPAGNSSKVRKLEVGDYLLIPFVAGDEFTAINSLFWRTKVFNEINRPHWWVGATTNSGPSSSTGGSSPPLKPDLPELSSGSGFFITKDGYFVTNQHVIADAKRIRLQVGTQTHTATVVRSDEANDLAILKVTGGYSALHVFGSSKLRLADRVSTIGFPLTTLQGVAPKYSEGSVSALSGAEDDHRYIQISIPVQPGNSGGPLVDSQGRVVGVVAAKLSMIRTLEEYGKLPENVNYAIKGSLLLTMMESISGLTEKLAPPPAALVSDPADMASAVEKSCALVLVER